MDNITAFIRVTVKSKGGTKELPKCINVNSIADIDPVEGEYQTVISLNNNNWFFVKENGSDVLSALNRAKCIVYVC